MDVKGYEWVIMGHEGHPVSETYHSFFTDEGPRAGVTADFIERLVVCHLKRFLFSLGIRVPTTRPAGGSVPFLWVRIRQVYSLFVDVKRSTQFLMECPDPNRLGPVIPNLQHGGGFWRLFQAEQFIA